MADDKEEQARRMASTLHSALNAPKRCLNCGKVRPAKQYKCECGKISTRRL